MLGQFNGRFTRALEGAKPQFIAPMPPPVVKMSAPKMGKLQIRKRRSRRCRFARRRRLTKKNAKDDFAPYRIRLSRSFRTDHFRLHSLLKGKIGPEQGQVLFGHVDKSEKPEMFLLLTNEDFDNALNILRREVFSPMDDVKLLLSAQMFGDPAVGFGPNCGRSLEVLRDRFRRMVFDGQSYLWLCKRHLAMKPRRLRAIEASVPMTELEDSFLRRLPSRELPAPEEFIRIQKYLPYPRDWKVLFLQYWVLRQEGALDDQQNSEPTEMTTLAVDKGNPLNIHRYLSAVDASEMKAGMETSAKLKVIGSVGGLIADTDAPYIVGQIWRGSSLYYVIKQLETVLGFQDILTVKSVQVTANIAYKIQFIAQESAIAIRSLCSRPIRVNEVVVLPNELYYLRLSEKTVLTFHGDGSGNDMVFVFVPNPQFDLNILKLRSDIKYCPIIKEVKYRNGEKQKETVCLAKRQYDGRQFSANRRMIDHKEHPSYLHAWVNKYQDVPSDSVIRMKLLRDVVRERTRLLRFRTDAQKHPFHGGIKMSRSVPNADSYNSNFVKSSRSLSSFLPDDREGIEVIKPQSFISPEELRPDISLPLVRSIQIMEPAPHNPIVYQFETKPAMSNFPLVERPDLSDPNQPEAPPGRKKVVCTRRARFGAPSYIRDLKSGTFLPTKDVQQESLRQRLYPVPYSSLRTPLEKLKPTPLAPIARP